MWHTEEVVRYGIFVFYKILWFMVKLYCRYLCHWEFVVDQIEIICLQDFPEEM